VRRRQAVLVPEGVITSELEVHRSHYIQMKFANFQSQQFFFQNNTDGINGDPI
jgi:hypothetical protein